MTKENFIAQESFNTEMYKTFINTLTVLKDITKKYDGKKLTKRFVDFIHDHITSENIPVEVSFENGPFFNPTHNLLIIYSKCWNIHNGPYFGRVYFSLQNKYDKFNHTQFCEECNKFINIYTSKLKNIEEFTQTVDKVLKEYNAIQERIKIFQASVPDQFKKYIEF